jgi:hypothetical protein
MAQPAQMVELLIVKFPSVSCYFLLGPNIPLSALFYSKQKMKKKGNVAIMYPCST